jgi:hypothetical protein
MAVDEKKRSWRGMQCSSACGQYMSITNSAGILSGRSGTLADCHELEEIQAAPPRSPDVLWCMSLIGK